jgi:hypothetical protein
MLLFSCMQIRQSLLKMTRITHVYVTLFISIATVLTRGYAEMNKILGRDPMAPPTDDTGAWISFTPHDCTMAPPAHRDHFHSSKWVCAEAEEVTSDSKHNLCLERFDSFDHPLKNPTTASKLWLSIGHYQLQKTTARDLAACDNFC